MLALVLALPWDLFATAHEVIPSDNPADFPSQYRYIMNGSELSVLGIGSIDLIPLSASLWSLSPEDFSSTIVGGNLQNVNSSTATGLSAYTIPYISCDDSDVMEVISDAFNSTDVRNVMAAVLYSETHTHCRISDTLAVAEWLNLLTVGDMEQAKQVAALELNNDSIGVIQIAADLSSLPPGTRLDPPRKGSPIPMIILYALTSMITVLLLIVIIGGAIKARRHPERYGPRARYMGRPRQSRAKGIAMAMLETLPIVRFGDPDPKQSKSVGTVEDVEMSPTTKETAAEIKDSEPKQQGAEDEPGTSKVIAELARPRTPLATSDKGSADLATNNPATPNPTAVEAAAPAAESLKAAEDSLSCSICTEDFTLGEALRVLPCNHKFHPLCVDPWLLNVSGTCPLCRIDLRPPQEITDENSQHPSIPTNINPVYANRAAAQQGLRSTLGGIMRGTRALDLQTINEASREERIWILRRWREERRPQGQQQADHDVNGAENADADVNAAVHRRSRVLSQRLRDRFSVWSSQDPLPPRSRNDGSEATERRPSTWYASEGSAGAETGTTTADSAPQLPRPPNDAATVDGRARAEDGERTSASQEGSLSEPRRR
ncbi:hypothetical protein GJ744_004282 [Endocarpon pusillum]|uniref:RING-type domain-containing protein n=1 Tax=Endocarpon pusillum TaxID=364733 RepID=A0A8H7DZ89_9EURO|nr:hypothetical protein GJ744_004282 [Endocarpon pusillum]